jgi:hypothetical protein
VFEEILSKHLRHEHSEKEGNDSQNQGDRGDGDSPLLFSFQIFTIFQKVRHRGKTDDGKDGQGRPVMESVVFVDHRGRRMIDAS